MTTLLQKIEARRAVNNATLARLQVTDVDADDRSTLENAFERIRAFVRGRRGYAYTLIAVRTVL